MKTRALALAAAGAIALVVAAVAIARDADAQRIDARKPSVFVVGAPGGASPTLRGDSHRTGATREILPSGTLHIAWRKTIGTTVDQPALAAADGSIAIVSSVRGDVIFLDQDGEEKARASAGNASVGPATMTSDGTVVFTTSIGDVVGIRRSSPRPRFTTRIGGERNLRAAPLSLDDGGVVVATGSDLVVLDAEGNVRSRVSLPESPASALLATGDRVIAVTASGAVYAWTPGREPVRVGSFGAPIDTGAALADANTLVAVIETNHLVDLDLSRGAVSTRSITTQGLYVGPPSVRSVGVPSGAASASTLASGLAMTPNRLFVVTLDAAGLETSRAPIATLTPEVLGDGGPKPLEFPGRHIGTLIDTRGAIAFATKDGHVGMVSPDGAVDTLGELVCARAGSSISGIAGLSAAGRGSFIVTCETGAAAKITGAEPESLRRLNPSTTPPRPTSTSAPNTPPKPDEDDDER